MKTSRPSSSSIVTTTSSISRPGTPTTPLPEVTLVAENLKGSKSGQSKNGNSNKYRVASAAAVNYGYDESRYQDKNSVDKLKENLRFSQLRLRQTEELSFKFVWEQEGSPVLSLYSNNFLMNYKKRKQ